MYDKYRWCIHFKPSIDMLQMVKGVCTSHFSSTAHAEFKVVKGFMILSSFLWFGVEDFVSGGWQIR